MTGNFLKYIGFTAIFISICMLFQYVQKKREENHVRNHMTGRIHSVSGDVKIVALFKPFFEPFLPLLRVLPLSSYRKKTRRYAVTAGIDEKITGDEFIGFQLASGILFLVLAFLRNASLFWLIVAFPAGILYPWIWLWEKRRSRQKEITATMPDIVDSLAMSVSAGLNLPDAIKRICDIFSDAKTAFFDELHRMRNLMQIGKMEADALKELGERVDTPEMYAFTSVLVQTRKLGTSVADVLEAQAAQMRHDRFIRAEKAGAAASQKLMIPMMLFLFPVIFLVILGPYILKFFF